MSVRAWTTFEKGGRLFIEIDEEYLDEFPMRNFLGPVSLSPGTSVTITEDQIVLSRDREYSPW